MPPFGPPAPCQGGPFPSADAGRADDAIAIGEVVFASLGYPYTASRFAAGAPPLTVPAIVPPNTRVVIAVSPDDRYVAGLDSSATPARTRRTPIARSPA